jgi:uncharacterized protein (DUF111 family)
LQEQLLAARTLDVTYAPLLIKNCPDHKLTLVCQPHDIEKLPDFGT